jgi:hypothetical protein
LVNRHSTTRLANNVYGSISYEVKIKQRGEDLRVNTEDYNKRMAVIKDQEDAAVKRGCKGNVNYRSLNYVFCFWNKLLLFKATIVTP